jgi:hypothetical protein
MDFDKRIDRIKEILRGYIELPQTETNINQLNTL